MSKKRITMYQIYVVCVGEYDPKGFNNPWSFRGMGRLTSPMLWPSVKAAREEIEQLKKQDEGFLQRRAGGEKQQFEYYYAPVKMTQL